MWGGGDISTFSFYPNKHITCGKGGMVLTNNGELSERCTLIRNLFFSPKKRYIHEELGYNFRMTNLQAALGYAQLEKLDRTIAKKRHIGAMYNSLLSDCQGIQLPVAEKLSRRGFYIPSGVNLTDEDQIYVADKLKKIIKNIV